MNLAALVEYDGTRFKGFQRQAPGKGPTVQGELEAAATRIADAPIMLEAAGRTDSGVHATGQVVSFLTEARHDPQTWRRALNALLPHDIAVRAVCVVGDEFHARKSALARRYSLPHLLRCGTDAVARALCLASGGAAGRRGDAASGGDAARRA